MRGVRYSLDAINESLEDGDGLKEGDNGQETRLIKIWWGRDVPDQPESGYLQGSNPVSVAQEVS